jgi:alkanesulfonate monooxygenase SsuD/methylene tetrahydromethanopterin reductase-like flavin-dependent oxidoreductase (luciferase family)
MHVVSSGTEQPEPTWVTHPWVEAGHAAISFGIVNGPRTDRHALADFVRQIEALGMDGFWLSDHPVLYPDCWVALAALADQTTRIRLGSLVACVAYRNPVVLARMAADIDALSNGRLVVGLGMGDIPDEFQQMGIVLRSVRERQEMLDETVGILRWLWGDTSTPPVGRHYNVTATPLKPGPVQRPRIPILMPAAASGSHCARWLSTRTPQTSARTHSRGASEEMRASAEDSER